MRVIVALSPDDYRNVSLELWRDTKWRKQVLKHSDANFPIFGRVLTGTECWVVLAEGMEPLKGFVQNLKQGVGLVEVFVVSKGRSFVVNQRQVTLLPDNPVDHRMGYNRDGQRKVSNIYESIPMPVYGYIRTIRGVYEREHIIPTSYILYIDCIAFCIYFVHAHRHPLRQYSPNARMRDVTVVWRRYVGYPVSCYTYICF